MTLRVEVATAPLRGVLRPPGDKSVSHRALILGGLAYTLGVVFYAWRRLPYNHAVWHCFVLAGSACHFTAG